MLNIKYYGLSSFLKIALARSARLTHVMLLTRVINLIIKTLVSNVNENASSWPVAQCIFSVALDIIVLTNYLLRNRVLFNSSK